MILTPITYTDEEIQKIVDLNLPWDNIENEELKAFKKVLYSKLKSNNYCPYCRRKLQRKKYDQIDHIIYKSDYNHYTFQPRNLVLACGRCNNNKLNKNVLLDCYIEEFKGRVWSDYPENSTYFKIIHPYYDDYEEHIDKKYSVFYKSKPESEKGRNTIEMMNLYGFDLLEDNARIIMDTSRDFVSAYINNPEYDDELILWAEFLMMDNAIKEKLFDILVAFGKSNAYKPIIVEDDYMILKNKILFDTDEQHVEFDIGINASSNYIRIINGIDNTENLNKYIEAFELLYKLRELDKSFEAALFLALIMLVKIKYNKYTKDNFKKCLAS